MAKSLLSSSWYRVSGVRPRLRTHARIHRRRLREKTEFLLQDLSTDQFHRFSPEAHFVIGLMDGTRTVDEIWNAANESLGETAPTQDELIHLLGQLHSVDALQSDLPPNLVELFERGEQRWRRDWRGRLLNPLAIQLPLFDPERLLTKALPLVKPLFGWSGLIVWLIVVGGGAGIAASHWQDLTADVTDRLLAPRNLVLIWLVFPIIKALHEFGHAFAVKAFGGQVHDMGVVLIVLAPVPYVDASAASEFRRKRERLLVGAAGMAVELFIASLAVFVWVSAETGLVRLVAYNAILIGGLTTVVFNANPLLRYDGYYMLSDFLEIPNLRQRANRYLGWVVERRLFGSRELDEPLASSAERAWFLFYAVASFGYRAMVTLAIALIVLDRFFYVGIVLIAVAVVGIALVPLARGVSFLLRSPRLRGVRGRAMGTTISIALALALLLLIPVPHLTLAQGVVWIPDEAIVRAGTAGFVDSVVAAPGAQVRDGDVLIKLRDSVLVSEERRLSARRRELETRSSRERTRDTVAMQLVDEELDYIDASLTLARERAAELEVRSRSDGNFVIPRAADLPGRFVRKGETLGYVVSLPTRRIRAVVPQADAGSLREGEVTAQVRLAERIDEPIVALIVRIVPAANAELPSSALGGQGGGLVVTDPSDPRGRMALEPVFEVELELPRGTPISGVGGRVHVRFDHGLEPLAVQGWRRVRQLFLARFDA